jgi:putative hydrolases of HD superfamily
MEFLPKRLAAQFRFLMELDKLKSVLRRSILSHENRVENSGEHSWHVVVVAMILEEHCDYPVDLFKVMKMLLVHDVVEIDAGDVYIYDTAGAEGKYEREQAAARRIFGLLPEDQASELLALWEEFEAKNTPDARFAGACDRLIPLLHNYCAQGHSWQEHGVAESQVIEINRVIGDASASLWDAAGRIIKESVARGYL